MRAQYVFRILTISCLLVGALSFVVWAGEKLHASPDEGNDASSAQADAGVSDAGVADAGPEPEQVTAAAPPPEPVTPQVDESLFPDAKEEEQRLPFAKGDMEAGFGLGLAGDGRETYLGVSGRYAYYIINRFAPGIDIQYTHIFVDESLGYDYPQSLVLLPFAKFVITRKNVAPFIKATFGYNIEWGVDHAVNAWIVGFGGGVHIRVGKMFAINLELTALHYWYSNTKIYWYKDSEVYSEVETGGKVLCKDPAHCPELGENDPLPEGSLELTKGDNRYHCPNPAQCPGIPGDKKDRDREWFFPLITIGFSVFF